MGALLISSILQIGNHDNPRSVTRLGGEEQARLAAMLTLTLPGTPGIYYGEEIGMIDSTSFTVSINLQIKDCDSEQSGVYMYNGLELN